MIGYIYAITNKINGKQYVGKTHLNIKKRFMQHINDSKRERNFNRPLHKAIRKYGEDNFSVGLLENCDKENLIEQEKYWIEKLNTYKNGYNATLGGDGKCYFEFSDSDVIKKYKELGKINKTREFFHCDAATIRKILIENNIKIISSQSISIKDRSRKIIGHSERYNIEFDSLNDAGKFIKKEQNRKATYSHIATTIGRCCQKRLEKAYGFIWEYV